ncbi:dermonecrotic toxin domain-containing protein [Pseudomonas cichorii]|nr:DUF6543 domain-containing protein [Pseudomonas cichorii]
MDDRWKYPSIASDLEHPDLVMLPGPDSERKDSLNGAGAFSLAPLYYSARERPLPEPDNPPPHSVEADAQAIHRLKRLRESPGFRLIADSVLLLKTLQLDMDCPPPQRTYVHLRLKSLLQQKTGKPLDPDHLHITFTTEACPSVDEQGRERYSAQLSLTELALECFDTSRLEDLLRCTIQDTPVEPTTPSLTSRTMFRLIADSSWADGYSDEINAFWRNHEATYRVLARLSFLDILARQFARKRISHDGYHLTLDALGFKNFPVTGQSLESASRGDYSEIRMLSLNGQAVPGLFQVRSRNTSHCFIHVLGCEAAICEYISDNPTHMAQKLLDELNASTLHRLWLSQHISVESTALVIETRVIEGDLFSHLTDAQKALALDQPATQDGAHVIDPLKPIARALTLAGAVDFWQAQPPILKRIPSPLKISAHLMGTVIHKLHGVKLNPDHVFIAYRSGTSRTPLGNIHQPASHVHVPSEKPVSLSEALVNNYRVEYPTGYTDHGGRSVVYQDPTGKGTWSPDQELPVTAEAIETQIKTIDFLALMTGRIDDFWERQADTIEQALKTTLMTQAVICLKQGSLLRSGFDAVVNALTTAQSRWLTLGFTVKSSFIDGTEQLYCAGLLVLEDSRTSHRVLYQAGLPKAFIEFRNNDGLKEYLRHASADEQWRNAVLGYIAQHHKERLEYLLKVWAGTQAPTPPASILRPWTDVLYNPDVRKALNHSWLERQLPGSPFTFMRQTLKQNALEDARQQIVTSAQVSLRYWTGRLNHLQLLLAPMSFLLTPALIASLATEIGIASLNIAAASQPGSRHEEKRQAILSALTLGLFNLAPFTPRLMGALSKISAPARSVARTGSSALVRPMNLTSSLRSSMSPRNTRLEKFFHTDTLLKLWTVPAQPIVGNLAIHAWKLGRKFLLWTSSRGQANTLVISTHGHYAPWSGTVKIPNGTQVHTYAPHGYILSDPKLHRVVSGKVATFAISDASGNTLAMPPSSLPSLVVTDKLMAGTALPGRLKNYTLSKFQTTTDETYQDIAHIVRNSNVSPFRHSLPPTPMDILTVRNRFAMSAPSLEELFNTLWELGIHYDRILLVHCRCSAIDELLRRAPDYHAPLLRPVFITTL